MTVIVSAGFPLLAFDDDEDILVVDSGTGKKRDPIAKGDAGGEGPGLELRRQPRSRYTSDGQVFLRNLLDKPTPRRRR